MSYRKIKSNDFVVVRTFDKRYANKKINSAEVGVKPADNSLWNKAEVIKKIQKIGDVIRKNEDLNLSPEEKDTIFNIISS
jgi:hypothetical protein